MIAELFQTTVPNISMHIRNIYAEGELTRAMPATQRQLTPTAKMHSMMYKSLHNAIMEVLLWYEHRFKWRMTRLAG